MFFSLFEAFQALIICAAMGFIFQDRFKKPRKFNYDPLLDYKRRWFRLDDWLFAMAITAPAIVLHELGHKFMAMAFGAQAWFHASYLGLGIGIFLKLIGSGFVIFVPAFVLISPLPDIQHSFVALAGPLVNLAIFGIIFFVRKNWKFSRNVSVALLLTQQINLVLFGFNMLPIPGFDGFQWLSGLISGLFG